SFSAEPFNERHQPDRRYGHPPWAEVECVRRRPAADRPHAGRVVVERRSHPHGDNVGQGALRFGEVAAGHQKLVDDLRLAEIPVEARTSGGAESAADRATYLRADADGGPCPGPRGGIVL